MIESSSQAQAVRVALALREFSEQTERMNEQFEKHLSPQDAASEPWREVQEWLGNVSLTLGIIGTVLAETLMAGSDDA